MAITRYAGDRFTANTSDTKPTGVLDGAYLIDTGNLTQYVRRTVAGTSQWSQLAGGGGGGTPGGANTQVQFNNAGAFGGDADLTFTDGNRLNVNKLGISGNIYDSNNSIGNNGMVLTNEGTTGVNWKNIESVLSGVGGSGVANYVARWSDEDTITTGALYDDGGSVGVGTTVLGEALTVNGKVEADEFLGELRGPVVFGAKAAEALVKGEAVYISGISGNTTVVAKACANETGKMPVFGLAHETVNANGFVEVTTFGTLSNINTSSFLEGDELFVGITAGALVNSPPTGEAAQIQKIAKVTRSDATVGSVKVMGAGRSNATPNLNEGRLFVGNSSNQAVADGTIHVDIANSKVGIGTNSPNTKVEIKGPGTSADTLNLNKGTGEGGLRFTFNGTNYVSYIRTFESSTIADNYMAIGVSNGNNTTGAEVMRLKGDGKVGIGTTTPDAKIRVSNSASSGGTFKFTDGSSRTLMDLGGGILSWNAGSVMGAGSWAGTADHQFQTLGTTRDTVLINGPASGTNHALYVTGLKSYFAGNVGIGNILSQAHTNENTSTVKLRVGSDTLTSNQSSAIQIGGYDSSGSGTLGAIEFFNHRDDSIAAKIQVRRDLESSTKLSAGQIDFYTDDGDNNLDVHMSIDALGRVGIGTVSPSETLEINHSNHEPVLIKSTGNYNSMITMDSNRSSANSYVGGLAGKWNGTQVASIYLRTGSDTTNKDDGYITLLTASSGTLVERMRINSDGSVGIGTTSPLAKLHVEGGPVRIIDSTGSPSYGARLVVGRDTAQDLEFHVDDLNCKIVADQDGDSDGNHSFILNREFAGSGANDFRIQKGGGSQLLINTDGNVGINNLSPEHRLHVAGDAIISGYLYDSTNSTGVDGYVLTSKEDGPQWKMIEDVLSGVGGNGTATYIPVWDDSDTIGDSALQDNGSNLLINSASPVDKGMVSNYFRNGNFTGDFLYPNDGNITIDTSVTHNNFNTLKFDTGPVNANYWDVWDQTDFPHSDKDHWTLSFWAKANVSGSVGIGSVSFGTPGGGGGHVFEVPNNDTWTKFTVYDSTPANASSKIECRLDLTNVSGFIHFSEIMTFQGDATYLADENDYIASIYDNSLMDQIYRDVNGNIGIGATAPASKLEVLAADPVLTVRDTEATVANASATLRLAESSATNTLNGHFDLKFAGSASGGDLDISRYNNTSLVAQGVRIKHDGNVGIGTNAPVARLHVHETTAGRIQLTNGTSNATASDGLAIAAELSTRAYFWLYENAYMQFATNNAERMRITADGNVGIGTTAPNTKLKVITSSTDVAIFQSTHATTTNFYISNSNATANNTANLYFGPANGVNGALIQAIAIEDFSTSANRTADLAFQTRKDGTFAQHMRITAGGNVSIGSSHTPQYPLDVKKPTNNNDDTIINARANWANTSADKKIGSVQFVAYDEDVNSGSDYITAKIGSRAANVWTAASNVNADLVFETVNSATLEEQVRIAHDGNVGIGTNAPVTLLDVYHATHSQITISSAGNQDSSLSLIEQSTSAPFGSASVYGFQWKYDGGDNKLYLSSGVDTNVVNRLTVQRDDGNVGIGTVTPKEKLHVNNGSNAGAGPVYPLRLSGGGQMSTAGDATGILFVQRDTNNDYGSYIRLTTTQTTPSYLNPRLEFGVQNNDTNVLGSVSTKMVITGSGSVGIGTTTPGQKLDIINGAIRISSSGETKIFFRETVATDTYADRWTIGNDDAINNAFVFSTGANFANSKLVILEDGNVGIGTTGPAAPLNVNGGAVIGGITRFTAGGTNELSVNLAVSECVGFGASNSAFTYFRRYSASIETFQIQPVHSGTNNGIISMVPYGGQVHIGMGNGTAAKSLLTISGNSDDGDDACALRIIDEDDTVGSKLPAIMFYGGSTIQGRIRGGDGTFSIAVGSTPTTAFSINTTSRKIAFGSYGSGTHTGTAAYRLMVDSSGNVIEGNLGAGVVDGSGTANYITKWTDTDTIGNSILQDLGYLYQTYSENNSTTWWTDSSSGFVIHNTNTTVGAGPSLKLRGADARITYGENSTNRDTLTFTSRKTEGTAGQEIVFDSDGNVGIGTTNPGTAKLYVRGGASSQTFLTGADELIVEGSDHAGISILAPAAKRAQLYFNSDAFLRWVDNDGVFSIDTSASASKIALGPSGADVGVGTNSPDSKLHVLGDTLKLERTNNAPALKLYNNNASPADDAALGYLQFTGKDNDGTANMVYSEVRGGVQSNTNTAVSGYLSFLTTNNGTAVTEAMRIISDGNVGIGTTNPSAKLHVNGSDDFLAYFKSSDNKAYIAIADDDTTGYISAENGLLSIGANTGAHASNLNADIGTGRFGLGTTNPSHRLTVTGSTFSSSSIRLNRSDVGVDNDSGIVFDADTNATDAMGMGGIWYQNSVDNNYNALIRVRTDNAAGTAGRIEFHAGIAVGNSSTPRMVIKGASGNVGIGTTNPGTLLEVAGVIKSSSTSRVQADTYNNSANSANIIYRSGTSTIVGNNANALVILDGGNVGIGTASPINKLHVVGQSVFDNNSSNINIKNTWSSGNHDINFIGGSTSGGTANNTAARIRCLATAPGGAATGDLTFTVNSGDTFVDALYIQEDGNVGIGSTQPGVALDVSGKLSIGSTNASYDLYNNGTTYLNDSVIIDALLSITGTAASQSIINSSTTDSAAADSYLNIFKTAGSGGGSRATLRVGYDATACFQISRIRNDANIYINSRQSGSAMVFQIQDIEKMNLTSSALTLVSGHQLRWGDSSTYITGSNSSDFLQFYPNGSVQLTLNSSGATIENDLIVDGSVGIGTTNPGTNKLYVNGNTMLDGTAYVDGNLTVDGNIHFESIGQYITFYGDNSRNHSIVANNSLGNAADDLRINTYGALYINLDSNNNNTSGANFFIGRHGGTGTLSDWLLDLSGETGKLRLYKYGSGTHTGTAAYRLMVDSSGNVIEGNLGAGVVDGSGTANKVAKWTDTDTIDDSQITDNGTNVGIGTATPSSKLVVQDNSTVSLANQPKILSEFTGTGADGRNFISITHEQSGTASALGAGVRFRTRVDTSGTAGYLNSYIFQSSPSQGHDMIYIAPKNMSFYVDGHDNDISGTTYTDYGTLALEIAESGSIGIGTASPTDKLHVVGNLKIAGNINPTADVSYSIGTSSLRWLAVYAARLLAGDGSASAPGITFINDTNTGLFRSGNDILNFATAGSERMRIAADGKVGIGTTSPDSKLEIAGGVYNSSLKIKGSGDNTGIQFEDSGGTTDGYIYAASGGIGLLDSGASWMIQCQNDSYIRFATNGNTEHMRIDAGGNVGIGTATPRTNLHVYGTGVDNGLAKIRIGGNTNNTAMLELAETENGSGVMTYGFSMRADGGTGGGSTNDFQIRYHNNSTSGVTGFHMERTDGNIGIGTISSGYKLQVNGAFAATTKSFVIDHPTKPGKKLRYASLEGPENGVYIRGKGESDVIELPDYWTELIHEDSITVNLTAIGTDSNNNIRAYSVKDIKDNKVYVYTDSSDNVYKYFFTVYGERKDVERLKVEID